MTSSASASASVRKNPEEPTSPSSSSIFTSSILIQTDDGRKYDSSIQYNRIIDDPYSYSHHHHHNHRTSSLRKIILYGGVMIIMVVVGYYLLISESSLGFSSFPLAKVTDRKYLGRTHPPKMIGNNNGTNNSSLVAKHYDSAEYHHLTSADEEEVVDDDIEDDVLRGTEDDDTIYSDDNTSSGNDVNNNQTNFSSVEEELGEAGSLEDSQYIMNAGASVETTTQTQISDNDSSDELEKMEHGSIEDFNANIYFGSGNDAMVEMKEEEEEEEEVTYHLDPAPDFDNEGNEGSWYVNNDKSMGKNDQGTLLPNQTNVPIETKEYSAAIDFSHDQNNNSVDVFKTIDIGGDRSDNLTLNENVASVEEDSDSDSVIIEQPAKEFSFANLWKGSNKAASESTDDDVER